MTWLPSPWSVLLNLIFFLRVIRPGKSILHFFREASKGVLENILPNFLKHSDVFEGFFGVEFIIRTYCGLLAETKAAPFILPFVFSPITPKQAVFLSVAIFRNQFMINT